MEQVVSSSIPASPKYFSFLMINHVNEEMKQKVKKNKNNNNASNFWSLANGRRQKCLIMLIEPINQELRLVLQQCPLYGHCLEVTTKLKPRDQRLESRQLC